jgi:hypothetical protein
MEQTHPQSAQAAAAATPDNRLRAIQEQIQSYYSNCAMLATTPLDISIYFGRLIPVNNEKGEQGLAEFFEKQVIVTVDQAKKIASALMQTVQVMESRREQANQQAQKQPAMPAASPAPQSPARKLNAALITDDADLELEIPLGDMQDNRQQAVQPVPSPMRAQIPAQAASAHQVPGKIEV